MRAVGKAITALIVGALAMVAIFTPLAAQQASGTVNVAVRNCSALNAPAQLSGDPGDCAPGSGLFSFYLVGDGLGDYEQLAVEGDGSIALPVGAYEVIEENTQVRMSVTVNADATSSIVFGFPVAGEPAPEEPAPEPDPVAETATLGVNTYACTGVVGAPVALTDVGSDCTRIATNVDLYLWGDGTDDSWNLTTSDTGAVSIDLPVGGYEIVNTSTWETLGAQLPSGGTTLSIGYAAEAAPAPDPEPELATLELSTYECTGVVGAPIALVDIGPDCTRVAFNLDLYLWGDGTDDSWNVPTSDAGSVTIDLPVGGYEIVNTATWGTLGAQLPSGGTTLSIGYASEAGPAPEPEPQMATLQVSTYACTGVDGAPIALVDIGPDCTPISTNLDFYLWGDGTDDSWNLTTSDSGPVAIDLQVGGFQVVDTTTWATLGTQVPSGGATLAIGYAAMAPVETGMVKVSAFECAGLSEPGILNEVGPDCNATSGEFTFYLWGDGTDDHAILSVDVSGVGSVKLPVGEYEVVEENTQVRMQIVVSEDDTTELAFGFPVTATVSVWMNAE